MGKRHTMPQEEVWGAQRAREVPGHRERQPKLLPFSVSWDHRSSQLLSVS